VSEDEPTRASEDGPRTSAVAGELVGGHQGPTGRWVLLAEAEEAVGMSRSWLRKQIARERLPAREVAGPTGKAWSVPLDRVRELAQATTERTHTGEHELGRSEVAVRADLARLQASFDAWAARLQESTDREWSRIALELAEARERAGSAEARARTADEVADLLRAEVERLRADAERLRAREQERSRWWKRRVG
jgi:hypothetical protein